MKLKWIIVAAAGLLVVQASAQEAEVFKTQKEKLSYALGMDLGASLRAQSIEVDPVVFGQAFKDALSGGKTLLTPEQARVVLASLQNDMKDKVTSKNKQEGEAFLAQNKTKEGIVALPSGLEYKILKAGDGKKPVLSDTVVCQYRGTLIDGTEFDSSYKRNQPVTFPVNRVIKGWTEALQLMPVGSKWQLFIPASLAYGDRGTGPIGPESTLIFEVELVSIQGKP